MNHHEVLTDVVEPLLRGRFGRPYLWQETCPSTQDVLRGSDLPRGAVAVTEHQTAGRGREGGWEDTPGASLPRLDPAAAAVGAPTEQLALVAGLAVAEAVEERGETAKVKWPNDVLIGGARSRASCSRQPGESWSAGSGST